MLLLRHRSMTDAPGNVWEWDPAGQSLRCVFDVAGLLVDAVVPVCSERRARPGAYGIARRQQDVWILMPARYEHEAFGVGPLIARPRRYDERIAMEFACLTGAPDSVSEEMSEA